MTGKVLAGLSWPMRLFAAVAVLLVGCGEASGPPRPLMPVRVTVEPHVPGTLELGVHLKLENLVDEAITVAVEIESDALRNSPGSDDPSVHPIFRGEGPVEITLSPRGTLDFWFTQDQLSAEDPILVTHRAYAAQLVRVPADAMRGSIEAIAVGPVE